MKLWKLHGTQPRFARMPEDFDTLVEHGGAIAGSAGTVCDRVRVMAEGAGTNYFIGQFSFGDLAHDEVMHSVSLFARGVLPKADWRVAPFLLTDSKVSAVDFIHLVDKCLVHCNLAPSRSAGFSTLPLAFLGKGIVRSVMTSGTL